MRPLPRFHASFMCAFVLSVTLIAASSRSATPPATSELDDLHAGPSYMPTPLSVPPPSPGLGAVLLDFGEESFVASTASNIVSEPTPAATTGFEAIFEKFAGPPSVRSVTFCVETCALKARVTSIATCSQKPVIAPTGCLPPTSIRSHIQASNATDEYSSIDSIGDGTVESGVNVDVDEAKSTMGSAKIDSIPPVLASFGIVFGVAIGGGYDHVLSGAKIIIRGAVAGIVSISLPIFAIIRTFCLLTMARPHVEAPRMGAPDDDQMLPGGVYAFPERFVVEPAGYTAEPAHRVEEPSGGI